MSNLPPPQSLRESLQRLAGYLNFSSGSKDPAIAATWNQVYELASRGDPLTGLPAWLVVKDWLVETLEELRQEKPAFSDISQSLRIVRLLWIELLPAYLDFHRDLLFHQEPEVVFNGFFMGVAAEAILTLDVDGEQQFASDEDLIQATISRLNDFVGYRPVALLENRRCEPYPNEFVRPIPLYVRDAGVSAGPYRDLIEAAIAVLRDTSEDILRWASFDFDQLHELALDPRAYDFDHPVNRRPNYHFGGWDDRSVGLDGYFHRFVLRQVTLDSLLSRVRDPELRDHEQIDREELLIEAATVLAGTILMGSGITGWGPSAYSSDVTLGTLMKPIAEYRDAFYQDRLAALTGDHLDRLTDEQHLRRQPFGAARQHLNAALAERRAAQVQHVQLARLYARMGYPKAAKRQSDVVPAASARIICRIDCEMTLGLRALRTGRMDVATSVPAIAFGLIRRGIECGAIIDPWDILGSGGMFSLHPSPDCSVQDSRVDDLLHLLEHLFSYMARVWSEAAARNDADAYEEISVRYREIAEWWRGFAAHTIESIEASDPLESYESAKLVARALKVWHEGGAAAGDVKFWAPHAEFFDSPRAYWLVISALLDRDDFVPAMALLIHWLGNASEIGLRQGGNSLPRLAERWLMRLRSQLEPAEALDQADRDAPTAKQPHEIWPLIQKCFDYLEANAEEFWSAPSFLLGENRGKVRDWDRELELADRDDGDHGDDADLFQAAYENMTYRDTTNDGNEGAVFETGDNVSNDELESESRRLIDRLSFLQSLCRMWSVAADIAVADESGTLVGVQQGSLQSWADRARENRIGLLELLDSVRRYKIKRSGSDKDSMREYDRSRVLRDSLMERIIGAAVEMSDARRLICGALMAHAAKNNVSVGENGLVGLSEMGKDDSQAVRLYSTILAGDANATRELFPEFIEAIANENLLYIPLSRGGDPVKIYLARLRQRVLRHLMHWLPRLGLLTEGCRLIEVSRRMEQQEVIGIGAVTEFDGLFRDGFRSLVQSLVESVRYRKPDGWDELVGRTTASVKESPPTGRRDSESKDVSEQSFAGADRASAAEITDLAQRWSADELIVLLERLTEIMLGSWLAHSQTLRLSPLESVNDHTRWKQLVAFIKEYGDPMFTQMFLQLGNVRAILHQGVKDWLQRVLQDKPMPIDDIKLFEDLQAERLTFKEADRWITLVYETLIDHHAEYQDYNSTTTQSDRGDLVYMFLDFLRLRARYDRIAWNLKPVMWAHEVLVGSGLENAAMMWRRSLSERIGVEADQYVKRLRDLQHDYSMRMPTVADRILERFVQPMTIARMTALVGPAMRDAEADRVSRHFDLLEQESELLTRHPTGAGLDIPAWLSALEEEVERLAKRQASSEIDPQSLMSVPIRALTVDEVQQQLAAAQQQGRRLPHMRPGQDES
ncbi:hypothetical protein [Stieleria varia]|uniref:Uncharacterized protein n=1 Tax=Stieleria varia TaxID=2528005 RepID=A0A5C6AYD2_9BACT|nr:hypothetical protein [Stieleria varia]TWU04973.1 hypothetical protein Pla52n_30180 [Stieleria varia]